MANHRCSCQSPRKLNHKHKEVEASAITNQHNDFLPRFTCFPASYSSLWRCTCLVSCPLNWLGAKDPNGEPQSPHKTRIHKPRAIHLSILSRTPAGKNQEPLT